MGQLTEIKGDRILTLTGLVSQLGVTLPAQPTSICVFVGCYVSKYFNLRIYFPCINQRKKT